MAAPRRLITQATFDEAVAENMTTFGMPSDEAVEDAVAQFCASGVDLANVVRAAPGPDRDAGHPVLAALAAISAAYHADDLSAAAASLRALAGECTRTPAHRSIAGANGAVARLALLLRKQEAAADAEGLLASAEVVRAVCLNHDDNRAAVGMESVDVLLRVAAATGKAATPQTTAQPDTSDVGGTYGSQRQRQQLHR